MKTKTSELLGPALNWAVARADGYDEEWLARQLKNPNPYTRCIPEFSTDWDEGGLIIEREGLSVIHDECAEEHWVAQTTHDIYGDGPTPLIAAMRCFVASKLGDEVEIPDGL